MDALTIGITSSLISSLIVGIITYILRGEQYRKNIQDAPSKFVSKLDNLIKRAIKEGKNNAMINGRAIVSMRDSFRRHTIALTELLNSDIDTLSRQLGQSNELIYIDQLATDKDEKLSSEQSYQIFNTILVLERTWEAKKDEVELEIRKIMVMLGLDRV